MELEDIKQALLWLKQTPIDCSPILITIESKAVITKIQNDRLPDTWDMREHLHLPSCVYHNTQLWLSMRLKRDLRVSAVNYLATILLSQYQAPREEESQVKKLNESSRLMQIYSHNTFSCVSM